MERKTGLGKNNISILGGGSWGTALALLQVQCGRNVTLWEFQNDLAAQLSKTRENKTFLPGFRLPESVHITSDLEEAVSRSDYIAFVVPSHVLRSVVHGVALYVDDSKKFISATKGIENGTLMRMSEIITEELRHVSNVPVAVLSGPSFAAEVAREAPTAVVAASADETYAREVQGLFMCPTFRVYANTDVTGVELGGSFKNVIAIASGIVDGVGFGDNTKAALLTRGIVEMTRLGEKLGADPKTFPGLSGMGDLILTCMGKLSRNLHVGFELGKGKELDDILGDMVNVAEGVKTAQSVRELSRREGIETPIMEKVCQILFDGVNPHDAVIDLMTRGPKKEH